MKNKTILVAEDEKTISLYFKTIFQEKPYNVIFAHNGEEAVQIFSQNKNIDLVLMDIRMPVLTGFEAIRKILEINPETPIIVQTAYLITSELRRCLKMGCKDALRKPVVKSLLFERIDYWLAQEEQKKIVTL